MSTFLQITAGPNTFIPVQNGRYIWSNMVLNGPRNEFKLSGGKVNRKGNTPNTFAITRLLEVDVPANPADPESTTFRSPTIVTVNFSVGQGITSGNLVDLLSTISAFATQENLTKLANGGS